MTSPKTAPPDYVAAVTTTTRIGLGVAALLLASGTAWRLFRPEHIQDARSLIVVGLASLLVLTWVREFLLLKMMWNLRRRGLVCCGIATLAILGVVMLMHLF